MEDELENLILFDEEVEAFQEENSVVHFSSLRNTLADLWYPIDGISITNLGEKHVLFQFFYEVDVNWIHNLPLGLMSKAMARQFRSFLGSFLDYDTKISMFVVKRYMRIKESDRTVSQRLDKDRNMNELPNWENESKVKGSNDSELMELGSDAMLGCQGNVKIDRLALQCRPARRNENLKLECSWAEEATCYKSSQE
ncbi:hypothetical protein Godav_011547 [Gossypium davidsonii]|uniref:DUF4283 domain-containing protein n=2 Tax=Gossypium TaxID=3633 RepID=A0A7J8RAA0_GOSDV|nr:hypothetical protein [Gossypium davidsonii]MBA0645837.1 hypothetical protein [Gossypium klotzschianum]